MIFKPDTLKDRVAIITGGGRGIGRVMALEFAKVGAKVVIASRKQERLDPVAQEVRHLGRSCLAIQTDVRYPDQIENLVQQTVQEFGRIDILVNGAAGNFSIPSEDLTTNGWNTVVNIVLNGTWYCTQAVGKVMIRQRKGKIVNMLNVRNRTASPGNVHNGAAKAAVEHMTRSLAWEWGRYNINVNALGPTPVETEVIEEMIKGDPAQREALVKTVPLGRLGRPEEVAWAAIFLCSDASDFITGQALFLDGGSWIDISTHIAHQFFSTAKSLPVDN